MTVLELYNVLGHLIANEHGAKWVDLFGTGRATYIHTVKDRIIICDKDTEDSVGPNGEVIL